MHQPDLFRRCRKLRREGRSAEALTLLQDALRRSQFDAEGVLQAGRLLHKHHLGRAGAHCELSVAVLGQCTTSWLVVATTAVSFARGMPAAITDGEYDNVVQEMIGLGEKTDVVVLVPWNQRLLGAQSDRSATDRIDDEIDFWKGVWQLASQKSVRLVQLGYDWQSPGALGQHLGGIGSGDVAVVRRLNQRLREELPPGAFFVDLDQISGTMGRESFYSPRRYAWTKQPFSDAGVVRIAESVVAALRALTRGPKKVLVVDLDNTLWGGVVGELGPLDVEVGGSPSGEAFRSFQQHLTALSQRGCLLAVCSKNNPQDAREPFERNADMLLRIDDFAAFEAGWEPKATMIERIADQLNLGLESFVFFDDEPAEREQVRQALPQVEVVDVPEEPADYVRALQAGGWFEAVGLTPEDLVRARQYRTQARRSAARAAFESIDDYLESLEMESVCETIHEENLSRVVQLIAKTNQFNLTSRRHGGDEIRSMLADPRSIGLALRVSDRFGDYGLVAVVLAIPDAESHVAALRIDTWLMSCRVIGRTLEARVFNELLAVARRRGVQKLIGEYVPTRKNALVGDLYERFGFVLVARDDEGMTSYELPLSAASEAKTFVRGLAQEG